MTVVASNYELKKNELYSTESWVPEVVLKHFPMAGLRVWEPAAGEHKMADVLVKHGATVITSDIETYGRPHTFIADFFDVGPWHHVMAGKVDAIFTNPPYGKQNAKAVTFARMALKRCDGWIVLVLTAKFDFGSTRYDLFGNNPRFHAKIALTDRISWEDNGKTGTEDHAVFVFRPAWHPHTLTRRAPIVIYQGKDT